VFDLVEAGAGNGRLSADILREVRRRDPDLYGRIRLHLVEASAEARAAQRATLGEMADRVVSCAGDLPAAFSGVLIANELLDALPVHQVVMRPEGLREIYVNVDRQRRSLLPLRTVEGPLSTPKLEEYLSRVGVSLEPGWRAEINLRAVDWVRDAARRLARGFIILIDYGHEARQLYSVAHADGSLTTFARHVAAGPAGAARGPAWLERPGEQDITAHVDFTSIRAAAEAEGLTTLGFMDQTYFLLALLEDPRPPVPDTREHHDASASASGGWAPRAFVNAAPALKTLLLPGGLGSTHKVLILGRNVGTPALRACSSRMRVS
jgi:SAM-dependent MidA family methyltransferase